MKIQIWIKKEDILSGDNSSNHVMDYITEYWTQCPVSMSAPDYQKYVQVSITPDEFAQLEDSKYTNTTGRSTENYTYPQFVEQHYKAEREDDWLVSQYNRNRAPEDWVKTREEIPYIYERNPDSGDVYRRRSGDTERELVTNDEFKASIKPIKKNLKHLLNEYSSVQGKDFDKWWKSLAKEEQIELSKFWE